MSMHEIENVCNFVGFAHNKPPHLNQAQDVIVRHNASVVEKVYFHIHNIVGGISDMLHVCWYMHIMCNIGDYYNILTVG